MVAFTAQIQVQKNSIGWIYVIIPANIAEQLQSENKKSFRVKGLIDECPIKQLALLPSGNGDYLLALNAGLRKKLKKRPNDNITLQLEVDKSAITIPEDFAACLADDEQANDYFFNGLTQGHRNYFIKWIDSAKQTETRIKRIAMSISALAKKWGYAEMIRHHKSNQLY